MVDKSMPTNVQQHNRRIGQQFAGNVGTFLLAARQAAVHVVADLRVLAPGQLQRLQYVVHAAHLLRMRHAIGHPQHRGVRQRLAQRQLRKEDVLLQNVADLAAPLLRDALTVQPNAARIDGLLAAERVQQGGFAAT